MPIALLVALAAGVTVLAIAGSAKARLSPIGLLAEGRISSPFGPRGPEGVHAGIDIAAPRGTEIRAAAPGTIVDISPNGERGGYGNTVIVEHPDRKGVLTLYAHQDHFAPGIAVGQAVDESTVLGYVGSTHLPMSEDSMGPHLHFEVHRSKVTTPSGHIVVNPNTPPRINPVIWLAQIGKPVADARPSGVA